MNLGLKNKVALITGSSKGLGFATAKQLAKEGAKVIISSSNEDNVKHTIAAIQQEIDNPDNVTGSVLNLSDINSIKNFVDQHAAQQGGLDIIITNTAGPKAGKFIDFSLADVTEAYQKLMAPTYELIKCAYPHLQKSESASILSIASLSVKQPIPGLFLSNILRPAITALNKNLSQELGPEGIRVNSILPGWISTDRSKQILASDKTAFEQTAIEQGIPLRRIGTPEEFGNAATFLVSPAASYINGVMLAVDGGSISGLS